MVRQNRELSSLLRVLTECITNDRNANERVTTYLTEENGINAVTSETAHCSFLDSKRILIRNIQVLFPLITIYYWHSFNHGLIDSFRTQIKKVSNRLVDGQFLTKLLDGIVKTNRI